MKMNKKEKQDIESLINRLMVSETMRTSSLKDGDFEKYNRWRDDQVRAIHEIYGKYNIELPGLIK